MLDVIWKSRPCVSVQNATFLNFSQLNLSKIRVKKCLPDLEKTQVIYQLTTIRSCGCWLLLVDCLSEQQWLYGWYLSIWNWLVNVPVFFCRLDARVNCRVAYLSTRLHYSRHTCYYGGRSSFHAFYVGEISTPACSLFLHREAILSVTHERISTLRFCGQYSLMQTSPVNSRIT